MALRYEWSFDLSVIGAVDMYVDDGTQFTVRIASGHLAHTSIAGVVPGVTAFATTLQTALNDATAPGTYTVAYSATTGYTIARTSATFDFDFTSGIAAAEGTRMRQILGFAGGDGGAGSYSSTVRPHYIILPSIQARSTMSDEYEPGDITSESVADDGSDYQVSRDTAEIWSDWTQQAETEAGPATAFADGTLVFKRQATAAAPWTYQHAWEHHRLGEHPFLVVDGSEQAVHRMRAEGSSFRPQRFAGQDLPHWSLSFRTRLLGRL